MVDYGKVTKHILVHKIGESRIEEIYQQFNLKKEDIELLDSLLSEWQPDYSLDHVIDLCQKYKRHPNISEILQAWELIAREAVAIRP